MGCYHPVVVPILAKPRYQGGKREQTGQLVGCGHCLGCRGDQARNWSIRIMHETLMHQNSWFVTLTYNDERIPENASLRPEDLRVFIKALRREEARTAQKEKRVPVPISYFSCGEYGGDNQRPHYHSVLYGPPLLDRRPWRMSGDHPIWRSETLESHWDHGNTEFGTVTPASAQYVAGYVEKKIHKLDDPDHYLRVDKDTGEIVQLEQEFARMSLNPAIGNRWIQKYWKDVYPRDYVVVDGKKFPPPRYYDKWLEENHPHIMELVRQRRSRRSEEEPQTKLNAKEKIHEARAGLYHQRNQV